MNERLDQWFTWPGVFPRSRRYAAARHVEAAPERLARHRHEQVAARHARHLRERGLRLGHVLEDLDRGGELELVVAERERRGLLDAELEVRAPALLPLARELRVVEVDAHDAPVAEALRPLHGEHALAAAHVEHRGGRGEPEELVEVGVEAGHQPLHDRVAGPVLVVGVAGGDVGARSRGAAAHSFSASRRAGLAGRGSRLRAGGGLAPGLAGAGLVVRGLDAQLELDAPDPLQDALLEHAAAGEDVSHDGQRRAAGRPR